MLYQNGSGLITKSNFGKEKDRSVFRNSLQVTFNTKNIENTVFNTKKN